MKPPLFSIFQQMRTYDRGMGRKGIGTEAYFLLLKTLEKGIGFNSEAQLKQLCIWLWCKPYHDREAFMEELDKAFKAYYALLEVEEVIQSAGERNLSAPPKRKGKNKQTNTSEKGREKQKKEKANTKEKDTAAQIEKEKSIIISFENAQLDRDAASLQFELGDVEKEIFQHAYHLNGNYFELSSRRLQQGMRAMRKVKKSASKKEFDLEKTIDKAANQGFLDQLAFQKGIILETDVILLVDHGDSMVAFEQFADEIVDVTGLDFNLQNQVYYFSEVPLRYLFLDKEHKKGKKITEVLQNKKAPVLIVSDAGAATGKVETERVEAIVDFLQKMKHHKIAWMNPMPRHRWKGTSADYISYYVPMLDANALEFGNVIKLFKSKIQGKTLL